MAFLSKLLEGPDTLVEVCPLWTMWSKSFQASPKPYLFGVGYYFFPVRCHATKTLRQELPMEDSPFKGVPHTDVQWRLFDCDGDGDLDLLRVNKSGHLLSCERTADGLDCSSIFKCLEEEEWQLSHQRDQLYSLDAWREDGRLAVLVSTTDSGVFKENGRPRFLQQGFCLPSQGCSGRGQCQHLAGKCECFQGHELVDCSGCQPGFSSVVGSDHRLSHGCAACATDQQGIRCSHRGVCYDDKLAKAHSVTSTKTVTKVTNTTRLFGVGNGSCICSQSRFQKIFFALNLWKLRAMESYTLCQKFPFSRGFLFSQWPPDMLSFCQPWS